MMDEEKLRELLKKGESPRVEWKSDFPKGLLRDEKGGFWKAGKAELLGDLIAIANDPIVTDPAYLGYGVKDREGERIVKGISKHFDDADFQSWATVYFDPLPVFSYSEISYEEKIIGVFEIKKTNNYPHVIKKSIGGIYEGQVWFRQGTQNKIALHATLKEMFKGNEPFKLTSQHDPRVKEFMAFYESQGRKISLRRLDNKDSLIYQGYEIATVPDTRREIWVGDLIMVFVPQK